MASTIADVARRAGVSTATVSRILSGAGSARPETRARVLDAVRELEFRPSLVARSLKRQATLTLGLIVTDIENPYFPQLVRAVEDAANAEGYAILLCNADEDPEREASYLDILVERRVDGMIVAASTIGTRQREWLTNPPLPVVLVNTTAPHVDLPSVASDNHAGGRIAARHLLDLGHRRFGYLMPPPRNVDAPDRLAGVRDELRAAGIDPDGTGLVIAGGPPTVAGGETAMDGILTATEGGEPGAADRPTAVIAYNDLMAIGALRPIRRRGLRVPQDISLIGFDDVAFAAYAEPALTTIRQETAEMGRWAVATLTERLAAGSNAPPPARIVLPVHLEVRGSTGPAPAG